MVAAERAPVLPSPPWREGAVVLGLFLVLAVAFVTWPGLDIWAAQQFFTAEGFYRPEDHLWLAIPYYGMPILSQLMLLGIFAGLLASWVRPAWRARRLYFGFVLLAAVIGPHLIVGELLKDQVGRARPTDVQHFGGTLSFSPAFVVAGQCDKNCSFVSAHVASAAFLMALGWLLPPARRRRWLQASVAFAALMGLARMAQGGHFLSDAIFAWFFVYLGAWLAHLVCWGWLGRGQRKDEHAQP